MINYIFLILLINTLIYFFYTYFKTNWPEEYFGPEDKVALFLSINPKRLLLFRIMPGASISILVFYYSGIVLSLHEWLLLSTFTMLFYGIATSGLCILKILVKSNSIILYSNKITQIVYHLASIVLLLIIGLVVGALCFLNIPSYLSGNIKSIIDNVVAALLYTAVIIPVYKTYKNSISLLDVNPDQIIEESIRKIRGNEVLYLELLSYCKKKKASSDLVLAFCAIENIQRPKWLRILENYWPWSKTRGIMQITSKRPISDIDSIKQAVDIYFVGLDDSKIDEDQLTIMIEKYTGSNSEKYLKLIEKALFAINYKWTQIINHNL